MTKLRQDIIPVTSYEEMTDSPRFNRPDKRVKEFTKIGQNCLMECRLEGERHFCNNNNVIEDEEVGDSSLVLFHQGEFPTTFPDTQTVHVKHLTGDKRTCASVIAQE